MKSTNYYNTFITVSPDSDATEGTVPEKETTIAGLQYSLINRSPYKFNSDDILFKIHAERNNLKNEDINLNKELFFSNPKACLRTSPLVKKFGWGLHYDENGMIAIYGVETEKYKKMTCRKDLKIIPGMRSRK
ncbi:MAG: hypothetical protein H6912_04335 [Kordiimonadaceae bacterium]|nr:hypothetical protein [Kordiimonadaceae bacterium]